MIHINKNTEHLILPRLDRCKNDHCNLYQLIIQNKANKEITVFKLRDCNYDNPIYYGFNFFLPDCVTPGEYDLYLVSNDEWEKGEINMDRPKDTIRTPNIGAIDSNGGILIAGDYLITNGIFKARFFDSELTQLTSENIGLLIHAESEDHSSGELCKHLCLIHTDLLKYKCDKVDYIEPNTYKTRGVYKEYKRNGR